MPTDITLLEHIFSVFTEISDWIVSAVTGLMPIFYSTDDGLTFLGILAVAGLGFSVVFLIIGLIQRFLHFRG